MPCRRTITGSNVAKFRSARGWTQETLASRMQCLKVEISRQQLANMECGRTLIPADLLEKFQEVFAVRLSAFYSREAQAREDRLVERDRLLKLPGHLTANLKPKPKLTSLARRSLR